MTRTKTEFIIVHGAWTPPNMDIGVDDIRQWHLERGFVDIGYHEVIRRCGMTEMGRRADEIGAHAKGYNSRSYGICLVGGKPANVLRYVSEEVPFHFIWEMNYTIEQLDVLSVRLLQLKTLYPDAEVIGHQDCAGTKKLCPGWDVKAWWNAG